MLRLKTKALLAVVMLASTTPAAEANSKGLFKAGAAAVELSPTKLPAIVNGGFLEATADRVHDPLFARCLVLDDGATRIAIVVVDSCMLPRELLDRAKALASKPTGIPTDCMLISATHTHSAPAAMGALGCSVDASYAESLPARIADSIVQAMKRRAPAKAGWGSIEDHEHTHCRRWIRRPDKLIADPFGITSVRANMHPDHRNPDVIGPAGPVDPGLSMLAVQTLEGRPLAILANYSMHYFGAAAVSADYFGRFAATLGARIGAQSGFVAMMSQGTSGDQQWMDYALAEPKITLEAYADAVAGYAEKAYRSINFRNDVTLAMAETTLTLRRRVPDEKRLAWAQPIVAKMAGRPPRDEPEVYAREAIFLHDQPERELKLQAIRIGTLGIAAIPNEVYALTGLKLKSRSPLASTFTIELANGSEGYIPPPEQHALGGYTTWPARTAALEVGAEPRIVETVLSLLERVSGAKRKQADEPLGPNASAIVASKPLAFWRLNEMEGSGAIDASGHGHHASFVGGVALYLDGPPLPGNATNHCVHLAGGYLKPPALPLEPPFSIELAFWNGLPVDVRPITGDLIAFGETGARISLANGRLIARSGPAEKPIASGSSPVPSNLWSHVTLVVERSAVSVFLDGSRTSEFQVARNLFGSVSLDSLKIGGAPGCTSTWEGKIDDVAIFNRVLTADEVAAHAGSEGPKSP